MCGRLWSLGGGIPVSPRSDLSAWATGVAARVLPPTVTDRERLDAIRAREQKATEGPWEVYIDSTTATPWAVQAGRGLFGAVARAATDQADYGKADIEFIAASREDVPWLLAEVERLTQAIQEALDVARSSSVPLGVTEARHWDRLLAETRRVLTRALEGENDE